MDYIKLFKSFFFMAFVLLITLPAEAQKIAVLMVNLDGKTENIAVPVSVDLDKITTIPDSAINLFEIAGNKRNVIPFQIENKGRRFLFFLVKANANPGKHRYELVKARTPEVKEAIQIVKDSGYVTITANHKNLLRYNYKTVYPPAGVDTVFKRSGFIHPLWSPKGQRLTRIGAPDHYHHFGLWDPWTHTYFEGDTVDF
ncbi:hypothetical protein GO621_09400 [Mucilaginibacter sp. HMF7410]|uniref:Uncharacterized protein n=1 Tax=Mucilaginibacter arboris TaxID=2682090 RepID=A0A7K1SWQ3_9SPHI|nr:hypothetical protein [Mucilaginibacter arboris]